VNAATRLSEELSFNIPWERGDVALVDNFVTMHGRRPFTGTRKVLASLIGEE
jgi:alpha-ketoglutarate-dependent taurine dioxygenase